MPDNIPDLRATYPELYARITPHIDAIVTELRSQQLNRGMVDSVVQEIIKRSGLDIYRNGTEEAKTSFMVNRNSNMRETYPFSTDDIIRILLLEKLFEYDTYY